MDVGGGGLLVLGARASGVVVLCRAAPGSGEAVPSEWSDIFSLRDLRRWDSCSSEAIWAWSSLFSFSRAMIWFTAGETVNMRERVGGEGDTSFEQGNLAALLIGNGEGVFELCIAVSELVSSPLFCLDSLPAGGFLARVGEVLDEGR